jgi:hypothetical protein
VVLFFAIHIYWYGGGSFGNPGKLPSGPHSLITWIFDLLIAAAFPIGVLTCLAIARGWARGGWALAAMTLVWTGCVLLLARGGLGVVDDLSRVTGVLRNGITGLSLQDTTGTQHPSAYIQWSSRAIDIYFMTGGIIIGVLARRYSRLRNQSASWERYRAM